MRLCHESIYQAIYQPGSVLVRPAKVASVQRSPLRTGRDHLRAHQRVDRFQPTDRSEAGHWEGDRATWKSHVVSGYTDWRLDC